MPLRATSLKKLTVTTVGAQKQVERSKRRTQDDDYDEISQIPE